jgi:hypothetical protein
MEFWAKGSTQMIMYQANNGLHPDCLRRRHEHQATF